ncbi:MAG TPA: hypothetical protein PLW31_00015 [Bacteroidales bacterium]|jgi:hypothetical protein|nr:hypothetical protein [Bacteroidales bacterium]HNQ82396.1 hypothetical protein [Bacteroidales bacterium]HOX76389.1 hypothetical protein [Bacteroidales bacterium]HPI84779.1 hypothetical protein [Bacteroidales bacterium]
MVHLLIGLLLLNCSGPCNSDLQSDPVINSVFSQSEIKDLSIILDFFTDQICSKHLMDSANTQKCFKNYLDRMNNDGKKGVIDINIPFELQRSVYTQISDSTLNEIWSFERSWIPHTSDTSKHIYYNPNGKYVKFLREFGEENKVIKNYYDSYVNTGDISPSMVADLQMNKDVYDINDIRIQLFVAIHYLTLNDQLERKEIY